VFTWMKPIAAWNASDLGFGGNAFTSQAMRE
jgi:hypothetical protein